MKQLFLLTIMPIDLESDSVYWSVEEKPPRFLNYREPVWVSFANFIWEPNTLKHFDQNTITGHNAEEQQTGENR